MMPHYSRRLVQLELLVEQHPEAALAVMRTIRDRADSLMVEAPNTPTVMIAEAVFRLIADLEDHARRAH
jgi:hypothetical protein